MTHKLAKLREASVEAVRTTVGAPQGLECTGYFILNNRTKHLRENLYVVIREEGGTERSFHPTRWWEHFPVLSLQWEGVRRQRTSEGRHLGAGGKEVIFECFGPEAKEGARIILRTMEELGDVLRQGFFSRLRVLAQADVEYRKVVPIPSRLHIGFSGNPPDPPHGFVPLAYRPEPNERRQTINRVEHRARLTRYREDPEGHVELVGHR